MTERKTTILGIITRRKCQVAKCVTKRNNHITEIVTRMIGSTRKIEIKVENAKHLIKQYHKGLLTCSKTLKGMTALQEPMSPQTLRSISTGPASSFPSGHPENLHSKTSSCLADTANSHISNEHSTRNLVKAMSEAKLLPACSLLAWFAYCPTISKFTCLPINLFLSPEYCSLNWCKLYSKA
ncbi:uncharacterized protein VP01_1531g2 [Puccinia sorghi]|uniref:Uncharacterized protein n=1 Tax=Puccinia sorghi TaxID=27349 RepID=A0A0L6VIQ2_9BASI|nr:uncharacterized protein VP01_1548g2 [Puccinia sorghi]KNZ60594.1 uncharacterized protein VP01_1531g2 [Puccinia sorghi]